MALRGSVERPSGFAYRPEFVSASDERLLLDFAAGLELHPVLIRDQPSRRLVRHFGYGYDYETWRVHEIEPIPSELEALRERAEALAQLAPGEFVEVLVTRYPAGAAIAWHRDAPAFAERIVGVSLGSACQLQLRSGEGAERRVFEQELEPRSAYLLSDAARTTWQHRIPPTPAERWSLTFRALRRGPSNGPPESGGS